MNNRTGLQDWISNSSRPSYENQAETGPLAENFWGSGQKRVFIKALENRGLKKHEIDYVRTKGMPRSNLILDKMLYD